MSWRSMAPAGAKAALHPLAQEARALIARRGAATGKPPSPGPLVVSGFLNDPRGIGEGARLTVAGLRRAGFAPLTHDLGAMFAKGGGGHALPGGPSGVWLLHCNAPEAAQAMGRIPAAQWRDRYRIGYWAYELQMLPRFWRRAAALFHEIWVPSRFVVDALTGGGVQVPVRLMPHPVALGFTPAAPDRARFAIPEGAFCVLCMGDLRSSATRKNLTGAIEAYCNAFGPNEGAMLVVKTLGEDSGGAFEARARAAARDRRDIRFIAGELEADAVASLMAACDLYFSPHRAEGFGLPLAEAMLHGAPALATAWSGNLEFMRTLPELLIRCSITPAADLDRVYRQRGAVWAAPDLKHAAERLRELRAAPQERAALAARGRAAVEALNASWTAQALEGTELARLTRR